MNESDEISRDKKADILQSTFEHYYKMAMDHHTKAATTSNILIVIVGALLVIVGLDKQICRSPEDIGSAITMILIGFIGAAWAWKQHERYLYWECYSKYYQIDLKKLMPEFKTKEDYYDDAKNYIKGKGRIMAFFADRKDSYFWVLLHIIVMLMGILLLIYSFIAQSC